MGILAKIKELEQEAMRTGMKIDWETASLIPNPLRGMTPHQRDVWAKHEQAYRDKRDHYDNYDNNPASPEQAGW